MSAVTSPNGRRWRATHKVTLRGKYHPTFVMLVGDCLYTAQEWRTGSGAMFYLSKGGFLSDAQCGRIDHMWSIKKLGKESA